MIMIAITQKFRNEMNLRLTISLLKANLVNL